MADLAQHTNYTGAYSGLVDNVYVTAAIAGICFIGYEIEVHIPRRRGKDGPFKGIPIRLLDVARRAWQGRRKEKIDTGEKGVATASSLGEKGNVAPDRLGSRESWEFG